MGPEPAVASTGPELSYVSSATSLGTESPSAEITLLPGEAEDKAFDLSWPLRISKMGKAPMLL
jgi:hypothetical protein